MCFITTTKIIEIKPKPKIAKEDIKVYKIITNIGRGWLRRMEDEEGKFLPYEKGWTYYDLDKPFSFTKDLSMNDCWTIEKGFHSCKTEVDAKDMYKDKNDIIVVMYIPKGAKYYENKNEYVSSELMYI